MLGEDGCTLKESKRPTLGLLVKPTVIGGPCEKKFTQAYFLEWLEYNEVLAKLVTHYTNKSVAEEVIDEIAKRIKVVNDKRKIGQELTSMEAYIEKWYYSIMANKPYYSVEEVKVLKLI